MEKSLEDSKNIRNVSGLDLDVKSAMERKIEDQRKQIYPSHCLASGSSSPGIRLLPPLWIIMKLAFKRFQSSSMETLFGDE